MKRVKRAINCAWAMWGAACLVALMLAAPLALSAQDRGRDRGDGGYGGGRQGDSRGGRGGGDSRGDRGDRGDRGGGRGDSGGDYSRSDRGSRDDSRGGSARSEHSSSRSAFTRSAEGRHYENGADLRAATRYTDRHWDRYFPSHYYSYPHYRSNFVALDVVFSPFSCYGDVCPPYIDRACVIFGRPSVIFIDVPIYVDRVWHGYHGYTSDDDDYYLSRGADTRWRDDRELKRAVYDIEDAFGQEDIGLLTPLTDPKTKIAIFSKGKYAYSLEANDYLDMTRDFMRASETTSFSVYRVHYRTSGVYQLFAKHSYKDKGGKTRKVYLCLVLEKISGQWTLTQVDTSPDRIQ